MKTALILVIFIVILFWPNRVAGFQDHAHYSREFDEHRYFRVFTPRGYNPDDTTKKYPVIYYLNGCGGSYSGDQYSSYSDYGYTPPYGDTLPYSKPFIGDFELFTDNHEVIVVTVDGKLYGSSYCDVYYVYDIYLAGAWNAYDFPKYIRELSAIVESLYNVKADPQYRAITGLSMGGQAALWISALNPHFFRSASQFCHSPVPRIVGGPSNFAMMDVRAFWRNYRGLSFRNSTNRGDYLHYFSGFLNITFQGAGFETDFHVSDAGRHWAGDVDSQFLFHMNTFSIKRPSVKCFSHINYAPKFDVWGYAVSCEKEDTGWVYLKDVSRNSLGIHTRREFPFVQNLPDFNISILTPPYYTPNNPYDLVRYSYREGGFSIEQVVSDAEGRLTIAGRGGMGEEIGINGDGPFAPLAVLADTVNETVYIENGKETPVSFKMANLSTEDLTDVRMTVSCENSRLTVLQGEKNFSVPGTSTVVVESLAVVKGTHTMNYDYYYYYPENIGYLKIGYAIGDSIQDREQYIQVHIMDSIKPVPDGNVMIMDGRTEILWGLVEISEGIGNGDSKPDSGEIFSIWINSSPTVPLLTEKNKDIKIMEFQYPYDKTMRSAQILLSTTPTRDNPVSFIVMTSWGSYSTDIRHEYFRVTLPLEDIGVEQGVHGGGGVVLKVWPNPFNSAVKIMVRRYAYGVKRVSLQIHNILGKKVADLTPYASRITPYTYIWNTSHLPSGIYLLRLNVNNRVFKRRLTLIK